MKNNELTLRIILQAPPAGVQYCLQKGSGHQYETEQTQQAAGGDLVFTLSTKVKADKNNLPDFSGPFVQGPVGERFIYLDIGTMAGQAASPWQRRLKIPLRGITWEMMEQATGTSLNVLETHVPGTGKDGTPTCATVKPFNGWQVAVR